MPYPQRLGRWPAALGILAFAWLELVYANRDDPRTLAVLALAYAAVQLVGMSLYGIEPWTTRADPFGVYFGPGRRLAPLTVRDRGLSLAAAARAARRSSTRWPGRSRSSAC